jgi:hypothetical protein
MQVRIDERIGVIRLIMVSSPCQRVARRALAFDEARRADGMLVSGSIVEIATLGCKLAVIGRQAVHRMRLCQKKRAPRSKNRLRT